MTVIYLVRHGEAQGNKQRIFHGVSDSELTEKGHLQASKAADALMGFGIEKIYSSDLRRAYDTAKAFSGLSGIEITSCRELREIDGGLWENKPWKVLLTMFPEEYSTWEHTPHIHAMPCGESIKALYERSVREFTRICDENKNRTIAVFTHGTFIRVLMCYLNRYQLNFLKYIPWQENTAITKIIYSNNSFEIIFEGKYDHLDPSEATVLNQKWSIGGNRKMSLSDYLFETEALQVSPYNKPFFYTTGKMGPFYINTHYLYGSSKEADSLLDVIDEQLVKDKTGISSVILEESRKQYENNMIFRSVVDNIESKIRSTFPIEKFTYISGGERRDWFFSYITAYMLNKKHITIFKDGSLIVSLNGENLSDNTILKNEDIIHVCDLVTEASSFKNFWIPAIRNAGNGISAVYSVVDRIQGGNEYFATENIELYSLVSINQNFFDIAEKYGRVSTSQNHMIKNYFKDPEGSMRNFLMSDPDFINNMAGYDKKSLSKARLMAEKNIYGLPSECLDKIKTALKY